MHDVNEIRDFINRYETSNGVSYGATNYGVGEIERVFSANKGEYLIPAFESHKNYNGNGQIVLKENYHRTTNPRAIERFVEEVIRAATPEYPVPDAGTEVTFIQPVNERDFNIGFVDEMRDIAPDEHGVVLTESTYFERAVRVCFPSTNTNWNYDVKYLRWDGWEMPEGNYLTVEQANALREFYVGEPEQYMPNKWVDKFNEVFPGLKLHYGAKASRVMRKICANLGMTDEGWFNSSFTSFADGINPLDVRRWTILSVNEIDYLSMSFGNSWSSCHTIDCTNLRDMPNGYQGMYSSGTLSYMLDKSTFVVYVIDDAWEDNGKPEYEPKILRQMYHYNNGTLIQGRLYPQSNDYDAEAKETRTTLRNIVQRVLSECFGFTNDWVTRRGRNEISRYTSSHGTHYMDYTEFDTCTISILRDHLDDVSTVEIGHNPICPQCGREHSDSECLLCPRCNEYEVCDECGDTIDPDDCIRVDGHVFCCDQCAENAGYVYCNNDWEWHYRDDSTVIYDDYLCEYVYDYWEEFIHTEDGTNYCCEENAEGDGYVRLEDGDWIHNSDAYEGEDGCWHRLSDREDEEVA